MRLLPSGEALAFLAQSAPRPWIKRMLKWMIYNAEITPFFTQGCIRAFDRIAFLSGDDGQVFTRGSTEFVEIARATFGDEIAAKIKETEYPEPIYEDAAYKWSFDDEPVEISAGFFVYFDEIDWEKGTLRAELIHNVIADENLFWNADDLFGSDLFDKPDFDVQLSGLCFPIDDIEMLQPEIELVSGAPVQSTKGGISGRPPKWNWEGAMAHVVALANHPDGLPMGSGAQAQIEKMIVDWFIETTKDSPAISQIRTRAQAILRSVEKMKS